MCIYLKLVRNRGMYTVFYDACYKTTALFQCLPFKQLSLPCSVLKINCFNVESNQRIFYFIYQFKLISILV